MKPKKCERMVTNWEGMPKPKKQQYIYVARDNVYKGGKWFSFTKFVKIKNADYKNGFFHWSRKYALRDEKIPQHIYNIKLKKGEQVRIPIDVERAEMVK